jgi:DNA-binding response OmpR family regulator
MRLLVVDDEVDFVQALQRGLQRAGYAVDVALDSDAGEALFVAYPYDLVILDLNLPGRDGLSLCRFLRASQPATRILILTARSHPSQRIAGLDEGADDYLIKPFHFGELKARIRSLVRRQAVLAEPLLRYQDLTLDPAACLLWQSGSPVEVTLKELRVLEYLLRHQGEVISQETLLDHVWDRNANPLTTTVRVHVLALRRKLGPGPAGESYIQTVIGGGYCVGARRPSQES